MLIFTRHPSNRGSSRGQHGRTTLYWQSTSRKPPTAGPCSSSDSVESIQGIMPSRGSVGQNVDAMIASDDQIMQGSSEMQAEPMVNHQHASAEGGGQVASDDQIMQECSESNDQVSQQQHQERSCNRDPDDVRLMKSRTYLLLLAGLHPSGGFWTSSASNHLAGDPILEDSHHKRYLAFFYFNAAAFAASLVMIIMLLNRKMSNKVIKRRLLETAMVIDLLALLGAFVVGSCREKTKSIYISVLIFIVGAYVVLHVLVWKLKHANGESPQIDCCSRDAGDKDLERRRNFLFILAILAASATYQSGLNPPGCIWPGEELKGGIPGNPVLQDSHPELYDVFYYSNAVSFVSSVAVIALLVSGESLEHGIKSYALRVWLIVGLLGLLTAYSAGSCRKVRPIICLILIAAAALACLVKL